MYTKLKLSPSAQTKQSKRQWVLNKLILAVDSVLQPKMPIPRGYNVRGASWKRRSNHFLSYEANRRMVYTERNLALKASWIACYVTTGILKQNLAHFLHCKIRWTDTHCTLYLQWNRNKYVFWFFYSSCLSCSHVFPNNKSTPPPIKSQFQPFGMIHTVSLSPNNTVEYWHMIREIRMAPMVTTLMAEPIFNEVLPLHLTRVTFISCKIRMAWILEQIWVPTGLWERLRRVPIIVLWFTAMHILQ